MASILVGAPPACLVLALLATAPAPHAQGDPSTLDLVPAAIVPIQSIQTGVTRLAAGRATIVRAGVRAYGTIPPGVTYDGVLRVYDHGVEIQGSPFYSTNGPKVPTPLPDYSKLDGTLNFVFLPPESDDLVLEVEVNPPGATQVLESDYANNVKTSAPQTFHCRSNGDVVFVPIDYAFAGGSPNLPDPALIRPGVGDGFLQAIYPPADHEYRRVDTGYKTWFSSLATSSGGVALAAQLAVDMQLMSPVPDFIYGWVPGALPGYNGVALSIPGVAAVGNTEPIRFQRTFAHELGHLHGLPHNSGQVNTIGIDVEHHLKDTQDLPQLLPPTQKDIMYAGLLTHEAWIWQPSHDVFFDNAAYACEVSAATDAPPPARFLIAGLHDRGGGGIALTDAVAIRGGKVTPPLAPEQGDLVMRVLDGDELLLELGVRTRTSLDGCAACRGATDEEGAPPPLGAFVVVLPESVDPERIERIVLTDPAAPGAGLEVARSARAPSARIDAVEPLGDGRARVFWSASDADGDALSAYLRASRDGTRSTPLATDLAGPGGAVEVDAALVPPPGQGFLELLVTDGLRTTSARWTPGPADAALGGNSPPQTSVVSPNEGQVHARGATVVLHASGYDVEDKFLHGASLVWTSDVDGVIGTGRVTSVQDLSVGQHVITVTATDSAGAVRADWRTITIADRPLPGEGACQADLGFGGPGAATLSVCGGDLSSGTSAAVALSGASPSAPLILVAGGTAGSLPIFGGVLVPGAPWMLVAGATDASGAWTLAGGLPGGGGPASFWLQAGYLDAGLPQGVGISNAVRADLLP